MTSIYLIRHGQASFGQENYDQLSDLGMQQAARLGSQLSQRLAMFDVINLGSMWRHEQTASHCLAEFGVDFCNSGAQVNAGWNEYNHQEILKVHRPEFATVASMTQFVKQQTNPRAFFEQEFNAAIDRWISGVHDQDYSESWHSFNQRVHAALEQVLSDHPNAKSIAVFTSGGPISLISQALLGVPAYKIMQMNWTLLNCGVTKIVSTGERRFLSSLNEHTHFEGTENKHLITYT